MRKEILRTFLIVARGDQTCGRPVEGVTQAQLDRIAQIAQNAYGYDPGATILSSPNEDEKYFLRLDWTINDDHNAAFTYNYNDGFNTSQSTVIPTNMNFRITFMSAALS